MALCDLARCPALPCLASPCSVLPFAPAHHDAKADVRSLRLRGDPCGPSGGPAGACTTSQRRCPGPSSGSPHRGRTGGERTA
eukprot:539232-Alexandrium_andersonii.AAC.1